MAMHFDTPESPVDETKRRASGEEEDEGGAAAAAADWLLRTKLYSKHATVAESPDRKTAHATSSTQLISRPASRCNFITVNGDNGALSAPVRRLFARFQILAESIWPCSAAGAQMRLAPNAWT